MFMFSGAAQATAAPDEVAATGILQHLNTDELQKLLDDDQKLSDLINDLPQIKSLEVEKQTLLTSNRSVAEYNLSQEPRLAQLKAQLAGTYEKAVDVQKSFEENKSKLDANASQQNLDTTLAVLQTEAAKAEEASEEISETLLSGDMEIETYIDQYIEGRKKAHTRRVKAEKMKEILDAQARGGAGVHSSPAMYNQSAKPTPYPTPAVGGQWNAPYPAPQSYAAMPNVAAYLPR